MRNCTNDSFIHPSIRGMLGLQFSYQSMGVSLVPDKMMGALETYTGFAAQNWVAVHSTSSLYQFKHTHLVRTKISCNR